MATVTLSSTDASRSQKPSGNIAWLKIGVATAGAAACLIAAVVYVVTSRMDHAPSMTELGRAAAAFAAAPFRAENGDTVTKVAKEQDGRQDGQPAISGVSTAQASTEAKAVPSQEPDVQYAWKNPAATATTAVVIEAVQRGDAMASLGDYAAARLLYRFAAERGSADAALKLAKTYDAAFLAMHRGSMPDLAEATRWYRVANDLQSGIQADQAGIEAE